MLAEISVATPLLEIVRDPTLDGVLTDTFCRRWHRFAASWRSTIHKSSCMPSPRRTRPAKITGALVLFHDITELKKMDQVRRDFVANVSHELRTPLSILRGYIETLLDSPETSREELSRILRVMERHSNRLDLLVEDLLTLAQLESTNPNLAIGRRRSVELLRRSGSRLGKEACKQTAQHDCRCSAGLVTDSR